MFQTFSLTELGNPLCIEHSSSKPVQRDARTYLYEKKSLSYRKEKLEQKDNSQYSYFTPFRTLQRHLFLLAEGPVLEVKENAMSLLPCQHHTHQSYALAESCSNTPLSQYPFI